MDLKSKKTNNKMLRLTRTVSMEAIFSKNYPHIWKNDVVKHQLKPNDTPQEAAWNQQMSAALAKHNSETHQKINLDGASSIILEKLNHMDLTKKIKNDRAPFLETLFLDDEILPGDDEDDEDAIEGLAPRKGKAFGVSYVEGAEALNKLSQWTQADMHALSGARITLKRYNFHFLGEEDDDEPFHHADDPNNNLLDESAWGLDGLDEADDDPNNELLDAAAWGIDELEEEEEEDETSAVDDSGVHVPAENLSVDLSPMEEMSTLNDEVLPSMDMSGNGDTAQPEQQNEHTSTSSDIVSVDNLLHKINLNKAKLDKQKNNLATNGNDAQISPQEIAPPPAEEGTPSPTNDISQEQADKQAAEQALKALKAQQNAENKARQKALKAQENAEKKVMKAQKKAQAQALKAQRRAEKKKLDAQKKIEKQTLNAQKQVDKKPRTAFDVLNENSRATIPAPALASDPMLNNDAQMIEAQVSDTLTDMPIDDIPPQDSLSAESILDDLASHSQLQTEPQAQDAPPIDEEFPAPQPVAPSQEVEEDKYQIQAMLSNNPLPPIAMDMPSSAEHQQVALNEVKNLLGLSQTDDAMPNIMPAPNPNADTIPSDDNTLDAFAHLQKVMADNLKQQQ